MAPLSQISSATSPASQWRSGSLARAGAARCPLRTQSHPVLHMKTEVPILNVPTYALPQPLAHLANPRVAFAARSFSGIRSPASEFQRTARRGCRATHHTKFFFS